jgi:hypothetical protein
MQRSSSDIGHSNLEDETPSMTEGKRLLPGVYSRARRGEVLLGSGGRRAAEPVECIVCQIC